MQTVAQNEATRTTENRGNPRHCGTVAITRDSTAPVGAQQPASRHEVSTLREHLADLVGVLCRYSHRIPSISDAADFRTEASNIVGDAMLCLAELDSELARRDEAACKDDTASSITCSDLRIRIGGSTKEVEDLQCTLAEAACRLDDLRGTQIEAIPSLDARIEARTRVHDQLASRLLEVFRVSVGLREMLSGLEQLADEKS